MDELREEGNIERHVRKEESMNVLHKRQRGGKKEREVNSTGIPHLQPCIASLHHPVQPLIAPRHAVTATAPTQAFEVYCAASTAHADAGST